ncbi:MAG: ArsR/SmtB family transcription factor [Haloferacaceae archaeon]
MSRDWSAQDDDGEGDGSTPDRLGSGDGGSDPERLDDLFAVLADERRRAVLHYFLLAEDDAASVGELADHAVERSDAIDSPDRLSVEFHHSTLPQLQDAGLVEYDRRSAAVRYRGGPLTEECLRLASDATRS